ncbi:MAG: hypothetical protein HZA32_13930 [Opitutae bacterium]|nr:hypothetical protein [Opitutae bacterium]
MKSTLSIILAAAAAGSVIAKLSNAAFLATVPGEVVFAAAASLAIVGITIADYARNIRPLTIKAPLSRVELPTGKRSNAYGVRRRSAIVERIAA